MDDHATAADLGNKKGCPWSEEEHRDFLSGLQSLGKGNWRGISRMFVPSRNPTQVASHAQKYFLRLTGCTKRRSRFSGLEQGTSSRSAKASGGRSSNASTGSGSSPTSSGTGSDDQLPPLLIMAAEAERRLSLPPPTLPPPTMMMPLPPFMMPPPHMAMFAGPGGAPFFAPVFFSPAGYGNQGMMLPMLPMGLPPALSAGPQGNTPPVKEGGGDSFGSEDAAAALAMHLAALCNAFKPAARQASKDDDGLFGRLGCFEAAAEPTAAQQQGCHVTLRASACSAFRPAARQLAST